MTLRIFGRAALVVAIALLLWTGGVVIGRTLAKRQMKPKPSAEGLVSPRFLTLPG